MKAYGLKLAEVEFDSKASNRRGTRGTIYSATGTKNALRSYKKAARRTGKAELRNAE